jgi:hypothetical protein
LRAWGPGHEAASTAGSIAGHFLTDCENVLKKSCPGAFFHDEARKTS